MDSVEVPRPDSFGGKAERWAGWFIYSAGAVLLLTGLAKVVSAFGHNQILTQPDPLLRISFGKLMLLVGVFEVVAALVCLFTEKRTLSLALVAWVSANFIVYRAGLWYIGWQRPCGCLGNLTDALHLSPVAADLLMKGVLAYLFIGSCACLWLRRFSGKPGLPAQPG